MPIYEYNGKRYNIPDEKVPQLIDRMPGATLVNEAPFYLAQTKEAPKNPTIDMDVPKVSNASFDSEVARQTAEKQFGGGVSLGQKENISDIAGDMYAKRELSLPTQPVPENAAQKQEGFWATGIGDAIEKLGAGAVRTFAGLGQAVKQNPNTMAPGEKLEGDTSDPSLALQGWFGTADKLSEKGDRFGKIRDPETGQVRKKTYQDLWKEGKPVQAAGEALLTAAESGVTSAIALAPYVGLPIVAISAAGQKYHQIESNPETKNIPEWKKVLNASVSGAIEGLTERLGAKVDLKVFEPILKNMGEETVKGILKKGGVGALIQTLTEGGEEVVSQLGTNAVDYVTDVSDEYKPLEGVQDAFVYGAAGGAQFGGVTGAGTVYRAAQKHAENVQYAKTEGTRKLWESINDKRSIALPTLNREKQQLEAELGDLTSLSFEEVANSPESTPELVEARRRYDVVNAEYEGVMENLKKEVDDFIAPRVQAIQDVAVDNQITELNIGTEEVPEIVYLKSGNVAINEDGTIDRENTAPILTVKNTDGKKKMISRKRIVTAQRDDLNTTIEMIKEQAYDQLVKPVAEKLEGKVHFQNGEQVEYVNEKGETVAGTVTAKQNNTVTIVGIDGKKTETFTEDELAKRLLGETIDDVNIRDVIQVNIDGQVYDADVTNIKDGVAELHIPSFPEAAGRFQDVNAEELRKIRVMPPVEGTVPSPESIKTSDISPQNKGITTEQTQQNVSETANVVTEGQNTESQDGPAITPEQQQEQFIASLPKTKEGEIDYDQIGDDDTFIAALKAEFPDDASEIVDEYKKQALKKLKDAGRIQDPVRRKRAQKQAQVSVDRFNQMYEKLNPRTQYEARVADLETGNVRERESKLGEYQSLRDYLLRNIATGKFKFKWNDTDTEQGLGGELFATKNQERERKKRISFLDNKGFTPESLAEHILQDVGQGSEIVPGWFTDDTNLRGEIIDVLLSYDTPSSMLEAATNLRKQPESLEEYEENFIDPAIIYEYEANEASQDEMLRSLPTEERQVDVSDEEIDTYFTQQISAEEYDNYINNSNFEINNTQNGTNSNKKTGAGGNQSDAVQVTGREEAANDSGRDRRSISGNQDEGSGYSPSPGETAVSGERSTPASIEQPPAEGTIQEAGRPVEGSTAGVNEAINYRDRVNELTRDIDTLVAERNRRFPNPDIESPMSADERDINERISKLQSERNYIIAQNRKENKDKSQQNLSETKDEEPVNLPQTEPSDIKNAEDVTEKSKGDAKKTFTFKQDSPMAYGRASKILDKVYRYPDGKVMTRYEWIESLPAGLEGNLIKVAANNEQGYNEVLTLDGIDITKTELDYYDYLQHGGMTISEKKEEDHRKYIEDKKRENAEKAAKDEEIRRKDEEIRKIREQDRKNLIRDAIVLSRDEFIEKGTKREREYVESFNRRRKKDSAYDSELSIAENNLEAVTNIAAKFFDMARSVYSLDESGEPVKKNNYKVGDEVVVTSGETPIKTAIKEIKGDIYVVEERDGIYNTHVEYEYIRPVNESPVDIIQKAKEEVGKDKLNKLKKEADDALKDFLDAFNDLNSDTLGIIENSAEKQAKMLIAGTRLVGAYTKLGVYKFADLVNGIAQRGIQVTEDLLSAIKKAYAAFSAENDIEELDDLRTIRAFKLDDINIPQSDENKSDKTSGNENKSLSLDSKRKFIQEVFDRIGNEKLNIVSLRKIADSVGLVDVKDTTLQEYTEMAIIERAKQIVNQDLSREEKYRQIVQLYADQPTISMRSSERIAKQQYSTPIPLSFIAGEFVNGINPQRVLEPSAGNGMMVFNINPGSVIANEIDEVRLENLREQPFGEVTSQDGTLEFNIDPVDGVVINPPFGKSDPRDYEGYKIPGLDEQMVVNALLSMKDDGRAAIIIGGNTKYNPNGTLASERAFLNYLYDKYNVVDVMNIDGSLYSKQGTSFPVRMILIDGRRTGFDAIARKYAPLQKNARSETVKSFDELLQRFNEDEKNLLHKRESLEPDRGDGRTSETQRGDRGTVQGGTATTGGQGRGGRREPGTSGGGLSVDGRPSDTTKPDSGLNDAGGSGIHDIQGDRGEGTDRGSGRDSRRIPGEDVSSLYDGSSTLPEPLKVDLNAEKTQYPARSKSEEIGSVVPTNMAQALDAILYKFKDIDTYVQVKLGYETKEEMFDALAAEQIDSVALAIRQIENGRGMIIGDMTGVGKGRQAAAIIRYAVREGKKPIFLTENANLFSDMYRDLRDIGSGDLKPFIVNSKGSAGDPSMTDENGIVIYSPLPDKAKNKIIKSQSIPDGYDYVAITYSQLNGNVKKNGMTDKQAFFASIATDNILILDESHKAGGDGNTGQFMASVLPNTKGVTYLSATFAKRPDNMPIYALKTDMSEANMSDEELIGAIQRGGVPLQEIMSKSLSETGQMVRRERDFTGVSIDWEQITENTEEIRGKFDGVIQIFNDLIKFQEDYINPAIERMNDDLATQQGQVENRKGTAKMGISNVPFASKTFNLVRQMLFSLKADHIADEAIKEIKAGRKPVIAIGNTMETFLSEMGEIGEVVDKHDYSLTLSKGLDGLFRITEVDASGNRVHKELPLSILSTVGKAKYDELKNRIDQFSSGITISPIDVIKDKVQKAGFRIGEMTGRKIELVFDENGVATIAKRQNTDKKKTARDFNSGDIDALILNQAAATGISLHASDKFNDQRQRVMLFAQNQLDVNTEVQMRGRIDRTGQVVRGAYRYMISPIPAEQRMIMMFKAKLKSLDANTTSSQKSKTNEIEVVDFLNKYGDEVVIEYLKENPDINEKLLDPYDMAGSDEESLSKIVRPEGAASKVAGHVALLTVKEQEQFYEEVTDKYNALIKYLNDVGENDLEITVMPLNAETKAKHVVIEGKNNGNPFAENSIRETVDVDVLKKPMSISEIDELIQSITEGKSPAEYRDSMIEFVDERIEAQIKKESQNIKERREENKAEYLEHLKKSKTRESLTKEQAESFSNQDAIEYDNVTNSQIQKRTEKIVETGAAVKRVIRMFPAGGMVMVPSTMKIDAFTTFSEGMFLGFRTKDKITPSTVTAVFAPHDGRRRIDVPLSKADFLMAIHSQTLANRRWMQVNRDNWDKSIPNKTRKTAYIITGNILQAYGKEDLRGQLISYTTSNGDVKQGILLPERYKADEQSMRVQVKNAADLLIEQGKPLIDHSNDVSIAKEDSRSYSISVPSPRVRGGKYFLDEGLRDLVVGRDFRQVAGKMVGVVKEDNIRKALEYLSDKFNISVDTEMKEITEEDVPEDIRFRSVDEAGFYSTVEDALDEIKQEKGTAEQFKSMLLKNGAKQAEMDWMGWDDQFPDATKKISKSDIQDWIDQNRIEVKEVKKGEVTISEDELPDYEMDIEIAADIETRDYFGITEPIFIENKYYLGDADEDTMNEIAEEKGYPDYDSLFDAMWDYYLDLVEEKEDALIHGDIKYSRWQLPGGENYRELLLTIPKKVKKDKANYSIVEIKTDKTIESFYTKEEAEKALKDYHKHTGDEELFKIVEGETNKKPILDNFESKHFYEPNILAHVRFNDREVNGERVLFIEEIQSDWAQTGREKGFENKKKINELKKKIEGAEKEFAKASDKINKSYPYADKVQLKNGTYLTPEIARAESMLAETMDAKTYNEINKEIDQLRQEQKDSYKDWIDKYTNLNKFKDELKADEIRRSKILGVVPDMPFKNTDQWVNLALRRMIRYAAENGYDRIAWTTGEQQADRYNLSKQVDRIVVDEENGRYSIMAIPKGKAELENIATATKENLSDYIGKELAERVIAEGGGDFRGDDLKVGGAGMKAFYDQIIPKAAKKLGKPFGADVETIELPWIGKQQSIPVTDKMREMASQGMPLFRKKYSEDKEAFAQREWNRAKKALNKIVELLHLDVEVLESTEGLTGKKATSKGWYDPKTGKITIVLPNHTSSGDVQATLLHEAVGHHGLREMFGEHFDTFLDNVYNNAEESIKDSIDKIAETHNGNIRLATEEYLSELAEDPRIMETDRVGNFFQNVKRFFMDMLAKIGFNPGFKLSDNELKYILWRSYNNLAEPGRYRNVIEQAKDIVMQSQLQVGDYAEAIPENEVAERKEEELQQADKLFDNIDNLKSVIDYTDFLRKVYEGAPDRGVIISEVRKLGFDKLERAIENYLANVEDPDELERIKQLLGVDMPDNALRYMLWRNVNPDDGTIIWRAKEAVKTHELDDNILFRQGEVPSSAKDNEYERRVRSRHNRGFHSLLYGVEEGWIDRMASLRILQEAITGGGAVPDNANAYMLENQLTSRNTAEIRFFNKHFIDPTIEQIQKIFGRDMNYADLYLNAKHGLERNRYMAKEEAKKKYAKKKEELQNLLDEGKINQDTFNSEMEEIDQKITEYGEKLYLTKDYSGLTAIADEKGREDFLNVAKEIIDEVEGRVSEEDIKTLWDNINKATKWTLAKQYNSGMMSKSTYDNIRSMFNYYVPLRGFDELTATDLYEYIQKPPSDFNATLKKTYGRKSRADSPTATIMNMAESGILQANRNRMKQAFYRLVATNPSNYASIEDVWYVKTADGWEERFPEIPENASGDEVAEIIADFNNDMNELAQNDQAVHGKNKLDVGVRIFKAQATEHAVRVWIAGEEKVVFVNGNPRAAQAINGIVEKKLFGDTKFQHGIEFLSRQMAANFTSRNPAFMVTNLMRDLQFALISASIKEGTGYSARLAKNFVVVGKTIKTNIFNEGNKGNPEFQKYWEEFLYNGGETGYANLHSVDYQRKYVNRKLREFSDQRDFLKIFRNYTQFMESSNRLVEDISRFATYVTSRQEGRSIERSVSDAKEITVNFNRKGSGGFLANFVHTFYLFANPAIQGLRLMGTLGKNHPVRFTAMLSATMAIGAIVPLINDLLLKLTGDDDDKDKYRNITPWVRRNNIVVYLPFPFTKDKFVTWMLPHEIRPFYGIGEMAYEAATGGLRNQNLLAESLKQMTTMLPIDPFSGPDWWVPDFAKPPLQSYYTNRNFMNVPLYRDTPWNKFDPEWTKAYKGTPDVLVEATKWASDVSGGDEVIPGRLNFNPARINNLLSGYMGGFLTTYTDIANIVFNLITGRDVRLNDIPVSNKLIRTSDEHTEELRINSEYYYYLNWIKEYEHKFKGYEKRMNDPEYAAKWSDMIPEKEQRMYQYAKSQISIIDEMSDYDEKEASRLKEEFVRTMWEYEDED